MTIAEREEAFEKTLKQMTYNVCKWLDNGKMIVRVTNWTIGEVLFSGSYNECLDFCKDNKLYHWEQE